MSVILSPEQWDSVFRPAEGQIFEYMVDVRYTWNDSTGLEYAWARNARPCHVCVDCAVPLKHDEVALVLFDNERRPSVDSIVCFDCVESQYLIERPRDRRHVLLAPFRTSVEVEA